MSEKRQCAGRVYDRQSMRGCPCSKSATTEHNGVAYCKLHNPELKRQRGEQKHAEWQAKWDAEIEASRKERRILDAKSAVIAAAKEWYHSSAKSDPAHALALAILRLNELEEQR